jgi:hypothetical protein
MPTHNLRQGVIKIQSGDSVPLVKTAAFTEGDFSFTRTKNTIQVKNRGALDHLRKGDEEAITYSFSAKFVDKTLRRTLEEFIFDGTTENITGLTPEASNPATPIAYAYEQDSLQPASGDAIVTKIANGATPSSDNEFAEPLKTRDDLEGVEMVGDAEGLPVVGGTFDAYPAAADTDMDIVFNAIGRSTLDPGASDVKTFRIDLCKLDVALAAQGVIDETYQLNHAVVETVEQAEGDEYDVVTFNGFAYITKATIV